MIEFRSLLAGLALPNCRLMPLLAMALVAACMGAATRAFGQELIKEEFSRELSIQAGGGLALNSREVASRELSLYVGDQVSSLNREAIAREVSLLVVTSAPPRSVTELSVSVSPTGETANLSWSGYPEIAERDVVSYRIYRSNVPFTDVTGLTPEKTVPAGTFTATFEGLPAYQDQYFAVVPVDALGGFVPNVSYAASYVLSPEVTSREYSVFFGGGGVTREAIAREIVLTVATSAPPAPVADLALTLSPDGQTATLNWVEYPELSEKDVVRYDIYRSDQPFSSITGLSPLRSVPAGSSTAIISGLPGGQDHYFAVVPVDVLGGFVPTVNFAVGAILFPEIVSREYTLFAGGAEISGGKQVISRELSMLRPTASVPAPVTGVSSGFAASTSLTAYRAVELDWSSYNEVSQNDVVRYRVYVGPAFFENVTGLTPWTYVPAGQRKAILTGLDGRGIYHFAVVAEDTLGGYNPVVRSLSAQASPNGVGEVLDLAVAVQATSLTFAWRAPESVGFLTGYRVYFGGAAVPLNLPATATSYVASPLQAATGYPFRITTVDVFGNESAGASLTAATLLPNPANVRTTGLDGQVAVAWDPVLPAALIRHFAVYVSPSPITTVAGLTPVATVSALTSSITGLTNGVTYHFAVATVNIAGGVTTAVTSVPGVPQRDEVGARVVGTTPSGIVAGSLASIDVQFSEAIAPASFTAADVQFTGPFGPILVTSMSALDTTTFRLGFASQVYTGNYVLRVGPSVLDLSGNAMNQDQDALNGEAADDVYATTLTLQGVNAPDLVVENVTLAGSGIPGTSATVNWRIRNIGNGPATAPWIDQVSLSYDGTLVRLYAIGSSAVSATLASGATLDRTLAFTVPLSGPVGLIKAAVRTDADAQVVEISEANNAAMSSGTLTIPARLSLTLSKVEILESDGPTASIATVQRNGDLSSALPVSLLSSDVTSATVPASVIIPAGQSGTTFPIAAVADSIVDGDMQPQITATAPAFAAVYTGIRVIDTNRYALSLTATEQTLLEGEATQLIVQRSGPNSSALVVTLAANNLSLIQFPSNVTIPEGGDSVAITVEAIQNFVIQPDRVVSLNVSAASYQADTIDFTVVDDDRPALVLSLGDTVVSESDGPDATYGTLSRDIISPSALNVTIGSNSSSVALPNQVTISGNSRETRFRIGLVDNGVNDGDRVASIVARVSFQGETLVESEPVELTILDDDAPRLALEIPRDVVGEGLSPAVVASVSRPSAQPHELLVTLTSSAPSTASAPSSVLIAANAISAQFPINTQLSPIKEGSRLVVFSAEAPSLRGSADSVMVSDEEKPDLLVNRIEIPSGGTVANSYATINFRIENEGLSTAKASTTLPWHDRIYISSTRSLADATLVSEQAFSSDLPRGQYYERSVPIRIPRDIGEYYIIVSTNAENFPNEITQTNNLRVSDVPLNVTAPYSATVQAGIDLGFTGQPVILSGRAYQSKSNEPAPFVLVDIHLKVRGTQRVISALTDANGNFSLPWTPLPGEGGRYSIAAGYPGTPMGEVQDRFNLLGIALSTSTVSLNLYESSTIAGNFEISNLADLMLNNLSFTPINAPSGLYVTATLSPTSSLESLATGVVNFTATSAEGTTGSGSFSLRIQSAEGLVYDVPVVWTIEALRARITADVDVVQSTMLVGGQRVVAINLKNEGGSPSGRLRALLPNAPWLTLASPQLVEALAPGESTTINLLLKPAIDLPLATYSGTLLIAGETEGANVSIPFSFQAVDNSKGSLNVVTVDEFTFFTEAKPKLSGVSVTIRDSVSNREITSGITGTEGAVIFSDLPSGYYVVEASAPKHSSARLNVFVEPGVSTERQLFLSYEAVRHNWSVVETEVQDRYRIKIESTFETNVPVPVVVADPGVINLDDLQNPGEAIQIDVTFTNHGLIAASNLTLSLPQGDGRLRFTALTTKLGTLGAKQSIKIPMVVERLSLGVEVASANFSGGSDRQQLAELPTSICPRISYTYDYICADGKITQGGLISIVWYFDECHPLEIGNGLNGSGEGGTITIRIGSVFNRGDCNECLVAILKFLVKLVEKFVPMDAWEKCVYSGSKCIIGLVAGPLEEWRIPNEKESWACLKPVFACYKAAKKSVPGWWKMIKIIDIVKDLELLKDCFVEGSKSSGVDLERLTDKRFGFGPAGSWETSSIEDLIVRTGRLEALFAPTRYIFGSELWSTVGDSVDPTLFFELLDGAIDEASDGGALLTSSEQAMLLNAGLKQGSDNDVVSFIARHNRTLSYWASGIFRVKDLSPGMNPDFVDLQEYARLCALTVAAFDASRNEGFGTVSASIQQVLVQFTALLSQPADGVCAKVKINLDQDLVTTRSAFVAAFELISGESGGNIEDVFVNLLVTDENGASADTNFSISEAKLSGIASIDGTGSVSNGSAATMRWTLVALDEAAPLSRKVYYIGGSVKYRLGDQVVSLQLQPVPIVVIPNAALTLKYFHQRDVVSDDPHTGAVENSEPYTLATLISNTGGGVARNLSIASAQPKIVDNEKGLLIDFQIIASELTEFTGSGITNRALSPSLTLNFGDLAPGATKVGRWLLTSSLQGLFIDYSATFEHIDSLGDPRLSLIKSVEIHELIRQIEDPLNVPAFLVNDVPDVRDFPDTVHTSDGATATVSVIETASVDSVPAGGDLVVELTAVTSAGWSYLRVADPANGQFRLISVRRSDGRVLKLGANAWVSDRTFIGLGRRPIRENILHIADFNSTGRYTLTYGVMPPFDTTPPTSAVAPLPAQSYVQVPLTWSGSDAGGLANFDVYVSENGAPFTLWKSDVSGTGALFVGEVGKSYGFYTRARDFAGNVEAAPPSPDASTTVSQVNLPPVLNPVSNQNIVEGATLGLQLRATDPNPNTVITYRLGRDVVPGVVLSPDTGQISWQTTTDHGGRTYPFQVEAWDNGNPRLGAFRNFDVFVGDTNTSPQISSVLPQSVRVGETLQVQLVATDADLPVQTLSFSTVGAKPAGMTVDATSGILAWTPSLGNAGSVALVRVRVTDNGVPAKSAETDVLISILGNLDLAFQQWQTENFTAEQLANPAIASDSADPNNNQRANLLEYALGQRPLGSGNPEEALRTSVAKSTTDGLYHARMTFRRRKNDPLMTYRPEVSSDRRVWRSGPDNVVEIHLTSISNEFEEVTVEDRSPLTAGGTRYFQLFVSRSSLLTP